jgi:hypothetical protein
VSEEFSVYPSSASIWHRKLEEKLEESMIQDSLVGGDH